MKLTLNRRPSNGHSTIGDLMIDGEHFCYTLEDVVREDPTPATPENEAKVYGETAIPAGEYRLVIDFSARFQRPMFHLLDVPGFTGIRIHGGNTDHDTLGCILVGNAVEGETIKYGTSQVALKALYNKVKPVLDAGKMVTISVNDAAGSNA